MIDNIVNVEYNKDVNKQTKQRTNKHLFAKERMKKMKKEMKKSIVVCEKYGTKNVVAVCDDKNKAIEWIQVYGIDSVECVYGVHAIADEVLVQESWYNGPGLRETEWLVSDYYDQLSDTLQRTTTVDDVRNRIYDMAVQGEKININKVFEMYRRCDKCHKYHSIDELCTKSGFCPTCDELYARCPVCGAIVYKQRIKTVKDIDIPLTVDEKRQFGNGVCSYCVDKLTSEYRNIASYHHSPSILFYNSSRQNTPLSRESDNHGTRYFGIEFETVITDYTLYDMHNKCNDCCDCDGDCDGGCDYYFDYDEASQEAVNMVLSRLKRRGFGRHIYAEEDGSLSPFGCEYITQPMTLAFLEKTDIINSFCNTVETAGYYTNNTCGMHVHINRKSLSKYTVAKLNVMLYRLEHRTNYDYVISRISEREDGLSEWSEIMNLEAVWNVVDTKDRYHIIYSEMHRHGRYMALNSQNPDTIEFRFFGGTIDAELIMDRLYFLNALCSYANNHSLESCMSITLDVLQEWDSRCNGLIRRYY